MQLTIGSSRLPNSDGIISVRGKEQIVLEWGSFSPELLLTMDLYGTNGNHIARLRRNEWTFNDYERFNFVANTRGFSLTDTKSDQVVLEARIVEGDSVVITQGAFYNSTGHQIEITAEDWTVTAAHAPTEPAALSTNPPFAEQEIKSIRQAVMASQDTVGCPRCGCPLTRERLADAAQPGSLLVSCMICSRNLVIRSES